jgi:cholesterol transport system auxiliary component
MIAAMNGASDKGHKVRAMIKATRVAPLLAAILLGGCISFGPKLPPQLISLTPSASAPVGDLPTLGTEPAIVVLDPETERALDVLRVPVKVSASGVAYMKDASWIAKPARQFRALVAETLRAQGKRMVLEGLEGQGGDRAVLSGRLVTMGFDATRGSVVVRYDALLTQPGGAIKARRFEAEVPSVAATGAAVGPALNQAANDVAAQVATWVG